MYIASTEDAFAIWGSDTDPQGKWEASSTKRVFDLCQQVGLKVLLTDSWILELSDISKTPDDKFNGLYPTQTDLVATVLERMAPYANHPAFYGVILQDEPQGTDSAARYGRIYKAIKAAYPGTYVHYNLLPGQDNEYYEAYIDATGSNYVMFDQYPMYTTHIYGQYIADIQRIAELCKDKGVDLQVVTQTMRMITGTPRRELDEADLYWLVNMLVGFGVEDIYYFTYYTKPDNATEDYEDGYAFIDDNGNPTGTYTAMQTIMAEMQLLAPYLSGYDYNASAVYAGAEDDGYANWSYDDGNHSHYSGIENGSFVNITGVSVDKERALVTELVRANGKYAYMVQNVADPDCTCSCNVAQTATLTFAEGVSKITVYTNGVAEEVTLTGNTYTVTQTAGQAVYIFVE